MSGRDWRDPFAEDPEAIARERRRAEREARRRERQASLAEKVQDVETAAPGAVDAATDGDRAAQAPAATPAATQAPPRPPTRVPAPAAPAGQPPPGRRPAPAASPASMRNRRIVGGLLLLGFAALLIFGVVKLIGGLGDDDPPPAKATKPLPKTKDLLIVEGLTRRQIADEVKKEVKGDYLEASDSSPKGFNLRKYDAAGAPNLEGFLFPATYPVTKKQTAKELVAAQLEEFRDNLAEVDLSYAKSKNLNTYDVLKIASMIEKEIQVPEERELAAAVIYNRLAAGTPLGIDATIRYEDNNYDEPLVQSRLEQPTPYNTRLNPGLPPTPIANPGLASIEAAANPAKSDAFFFVVKPGTCGEHVFVETEEEFARAEAEYQAALEAEGGSPTEC